MRNLVSERIDALPRAETGERAIPVSFAMRCTHRSWTLRGAVAPIWRLASVSRSKPFGRALVSWRTWGGATAACKEQSVRSYR
jgi:hypothetical protein